MVKCADCGFITLRNINTRELLEVENEYRINGVIKSSHEILPLCFENSFDIANEVETIQKSVNDESKEDGQGGVISPNWASHIKFVLDTERECKSFRKYQLGLTPKEHREMMDREWMLKREDERRHNDRKWHWIQLAVVIIGTGLFSLFINWIARSF